MKPFSKTDAAASQVPRDPFLLSTKFCVGWTALGTFAVLCSVNALLRLARSEVEIDGGIPYREVSTMETLALATPIVAVVLLAFLYLALLHARARKVVGLAPGYPPVFSVAWSGSLAEGLGRTLIRFAILFPLLTLGLLCHKTLQQPLHIGKSLLTAHPFESLHRIDLLADSRFWQGRIFLGRPGSGSITFFPVLQPLAYLGAACAAALMTARLAATHRGQIAPRSDYTSADD